MKSIINELKRRKLDIALLIGLVLTLLVSDFTAFKQNYDNLQKDVLRMHILANSDSDDDQAVKLKVRDALLKNSEILFEGCDTMEELTARANDVKDKIVDIANGVLAENGFTYTASCEVTNMEFDDRVYGELTMPAGEYEAVRVTLGNADGKNWWCVMYPPLCIPYATGFEEIEKSDEPDIEKAIETDTETSTETDTNVSNRNFFTKFLHPQNEILNADSTNDTANSNNSNIVQTLENESQTITTQNEEDYFTEGELDIMRKPKKYKIKFKIVELFNDWF
jgi:stage II sporulation protein R